MCCYLFYSVEKAALLSDEIDMQSGGKIMNDVAAAVSCVLVHISLNWIFFRPFFRGVGSWISRNLHDNDKIGNVT